ncbi:MAG: radical SAM protein [Candidatus Gracilibacteria bacterium]|nr:radical SAM protein [Candidatus Gracilibacteria bacterium]
MEYKIFGCKVNKYYTDKWLNSEKLEGEKGIFIASCVVTDNAKRKWIKFVKDTFKTLEGSKKVFISGCGAFKDGRAQEDFFELYPDLEVFKDRIIILGEDPDEVDIKNGQKVLTVKQKQISKAKIKNISSKLAGIYTKKFILIQGGCDSFCTFCLTVIKRGRHFSRSKEDILDDILDFEKTGGKEVVLTGINLSAWGLDSTNPSPNLSLRGEGQIDSRLAELLEYLLDNSNIPRIRISSMGPEFVDDKCFEVFKNTRIYPHFHYSVQSGSTDVLKNMKRHYNGDYMRKVLEKTMNLKREDGVKISIGADIIVGFPGESSEDFKQSIDLIKNYGIKKVHAFPFSGHKLGENVPAGFLIIKLTEK